ncbi:MAG: hypothetical protein EPO11_05825 [Gammaproteobacteria bacterium]|nr:MAG: hypothetical protein EPO11_05825 [Gammaproteobacteria bacterium]
MKLSNMIINNNLPQRAAAGSCVLIALFVGFTFFYALWQWHSDWVLAHQPMTAPVLTTSDATTSLIAAIPDEHLFGAGVGEMPISSLQLRVTGIVKMEGALSKAYISIAGQSSKIYRTGDSLPYGVTVHDITSDAVILENDGHLEKLPLPREQLAFKMRNAEELVS